MVELSPSSALDHPARMERISWIEGFRGLAALAVVLWHTSNYVLPYGEGIIGRLLWPGSIFAVDLFFILSGFVMVVSTTGKRSVPGVGAFIFKRLIRLFPLYALATLAYMLIAPVAVPTWETLAFSLLFLPGSIAAGAPVYGFPIISVGWTLNYEMYFYLAFGLSLLFGKWRWVSLACWMAVMVLAVPLLGRGSSPLLAVEAHNPFASSALNMASNPIILLFACGMFCGGLHVKGIRFGTAKTSLALRGLALALVVAQYLAVFHITHGVFGVGLTLIPLAFVFTVTCPCPVPLAGTLRYLGAISYALYLAHPIVIVVLALPLHQGRMGLLSMFNTTMVSVAVAVLAHHCLEQPIVAAFRTVIGRHRGGLIAPAAIPREATSTERAPATPPAPTPTAPAAP